MVTTPKKQHLDGILENSENQGRFQEIEKSGTIEFLFLRYISMT